MIGQLVRALDASPHARNTVIVFWSDNGWHLGEKRHWHKSTLWQRSTHVPMIWAGPGIRRPGVARKQPVTLLDIYPSLVQMCGLPHKADLEGESLTPLLSDPSAKRKPAVSTYMPENHAVITEKWRYIRYRDGGEELYDRAADPNEWKNLAGEEKHAALKKELSQWMPRSSAAPVPDRNQFDFDFKTYSYKRKGG
jgi:arylsulfatase A-like enzyme